MRVELDHNEGQTKRVLSPMENIECPNCDEPLKLMKTTSRSGSVIEVVSTGKHFETVNRYFRCQTCGYGGKSIEWRPIPAHSCCVDSLSNSRVNTAYEKNVSGDLVWERHRSALCVCGRTYAWRERMLVGKGKA